MTIVAAADGSALGNPGPAGWAWYIDESTWRAGGWRHGTNNMGELKAVLDLLEATAHLGQPLKVFCDSQYVINSITRWMPGWKAKGWKKKDGKPVLNVELMQALDAALQGRQVDFEWVKGHAGHPLNEAADARAHAAAQAFQSGQQPETGPGIEGYLKTSDTDNSPLHDQQPQHHEIRRIRHGVDPQYVHPDAVLIGADGLPIGPEDMRVGYPEADIHCVQVLEVSDHAVLVTTHVINGACGHHVSVQTSLWVAGDLSIRDGAWLLRHHQVTAEVDRR